MIRVIGLTTLDIPTLIRQAYEDGMNIASPLDEVGKDPRGLDSALITLSNMCRGDASREIWISSLRHVSMSVLTDQIDASGMIQFPLSILQTNLTNKALIITGTVSQWIEAINAASVEAQKTEIRRFFNAIYTYLDAKGLSPLWESFHRSSLEDGTIILFHNQ
jgi:hypothetical protein